MKSRGFKGKLSSLFSFCFHKIQQRVDQKAAIGQNDAARNVGGLIRAHELHDGCHLPWLTQSAQKRLLREFLVHCAPNAVAVEDWRVDWARTVEKENLGQKDCQIRDFNELTRTPFGEPICANPRVHWSKADFMEA